MSNRLLHGKSSLLMHLLLMLAVGLGLSLRGTTADWPQFQGPDRNGISTETGLAHHWPKEGPKQRWVAALAESYGGAVVVGGQIFIMDRVGEGDHGHDILHCLDLDGGQELWRFSYAAPGEFDLLGARCTPAVDAKCIYTIGPTGQLYCIDRHTHQPLWNANIISDYQGECPRWGVAQSPLLHNDRIIVAPQSASTGMVALNKATGKEIWRSEPLGLMSYASPLLTTIDNVEQIVMLTSGKNYQANNIVAGIRAADGKVLWQYRDWKCLIPVPSPTPLGDGRFFLTGGSGAQGTVFKVEHREDRWLCRTVVKNIPCASNIQNVLCYQDHLYLNSADNGKGLLCLNLQGDILWQHNATPPLEQGGNLIIADGMIFFTHGKNGKLYLVNANPAAYTELAAITVLDPSNNWAPMALADGRLLIRDKGHLRCLDVRPPAPVVHTRSEQ